ncbi:hypothetical protein ACQJBY_026598 [Aegilops geniculata]
MASSPLEFEDLSRTCRRDRFCQLCARAFCSHCCGYHHSGPFHSVIPVDVDAAGRPVFSTTFEFGDSEQSLRLRDAVVGTIAAEDYATPLPRDSYCMACRRIFCAGACSHHHDLCGPDAVLHIREHGGAYCVRCTGSEPWFPHMESILGDPLGEDRDEHGRCQLLLPVLRRAPGKCAQCGAQVQWDSKEHCSEPCAAAHQQEVDRRRERREARRAARELAKLQIH